MQTIESIHGIAKIFNNSSSAGELCQLLAHSSDLDWDIRGAQLHSITNRGNLKHIASYGVEFDLGIQGLFEEAELAQKIRQITPFISHQTKVVILPLQRASVPVGLLAFSANLSKELEDEFIAINDYVSYLGGLFLDTLGIRDLFRDSMSEEDPASLTERQIVILEGMAQEKTNLQISQELLVSESTVKQETVRIYRALGVSTRQHAVAKAKAIGLLSPPPPPIKSSANY